MNARGSWDTPPPKTGPKPLPEQRQNESGPSYFFRVLAWYRDPNRQAPEYREWLAKRKWEGETSSDLLAALRESRDLPGREWSFVNERPQALTPLE